ncbi:CDP-glycerol glycerophosphotransferase family protein [Butyrivibrio sp. AD3002]|uniref:CDP-glycerol glycerophosphotransferase family protein n=1 Tax=Butyrivibrio sp. AD3002 TaxID=1280670 RepID=UPI0003B58E56|nr:CDP-glycerol glycerophosphotransferase family protein [Butyrivibrio sp. AD3002]
MSFFNNKKVSGKNVVRSTMLENRSKAGAVKLWLTRKWLFPFLYHLYALKPIQENKVIFMEIRFGNLTDTYQEIFNELVCNYNMDIHCHFFREGFVLKPAELKRQIDFVKDAATAKYLIYNDSSNTQGSFKVRKGTKVLNTWHGAGAFKKFGNSTIKKIFGGTEKDRATYKLHPKYHTVTVSSPEVEWAYIEAMGMEYNSQCVKGIGISRTDVFYKESFINAARDHFYDILPQAKGKKVILYAPTFRGMPRSAITPDMLEIGKFYEKFKDEYVLVYKHHPLVKIRPTIPTDYRKFAVDLTDDMSISELLCVTDICITDYSSLIFEFSIFEKPMIFFAYDLANYFDWRGFYYNYDELTPGPICYTNSEMVDYIEHIDERFDREKVHAFREKFMSACDGHATERIMKEFFGDDIEQFRRPAPVEGDFCDLPDAKILFRDEKKRIDRMKKLMNKAASAYRKAAKQPVIENRVAFLPDEASDWDVFYSLEKVLKENEGQYEIIKDVTYNAKNIESFVSKLAGAKVIFCSGEPYILRMIELREETKLIQISPELIPLYPKWISSKEIISGYNVEENRYFPIRSKYNAVMGSAEKDNELFAKNYKLAEDGKVVNIGNITTDMLFDEEFKANARKRLETICPYSTGKKIVLFLCKDRESAVGYLNRVMTMMHEAYAREYVCVGMVCDGKPGRRLEISEYLEGFAFDPRFVLAQRVAQQEADSLDGDAMPDSAGGVRMDKIDWKNVAPITHTEAIAIADIVVGDYCSQMFEAAIIKKPLFIWTPDRITFGREQEFYFDYDNLLPEITCSSNAELLQKVNDIDNYDYSALERFCERYISNCDGNTSVRVKEILENLMKK